MFTDLIQQRFQYLVDEHGFAVRVDGPVVHYASGCCGVTVYVDEGGEVVVMLRSKEPQSSCPAELWLENILLVQNPKFRFKHAWNVKKFATDPAGHIDKQLTEQARLLRDECDVMLHGDFSIQREVEDLQRKRVEPLLRFLRDEAPVRWRRKQFPP
jgi:hypothetical protein